MQMLLSPQNQPLKTILSPAIINRTTNVGGSQMNQLGGTKVTKMSTGGQISVDQKENVFSSGQESSDVLVASQRRSNSQGSYEQIKRKFKKQRGLAQKIVLPKRSTFLSKSGIGSATGSQIIEGNAPSYLNNSALISGNLNRGPSMSENTEYTPFKV